MFMNALYSCQVNVPFIQIIKEIKETTGPRWGWNMWNLSSYHLPAQIQQ